MSKWQNIRLGDIADFSNGINFDKSSYCEEGTYLVGVSDFGEELLPDYSTLRHIDSAIVRECNLLKDGDIVFVRSNGNKALVGRSMLIKTPPKNTSFSGFCIRARIKDHESFDPLFFAYLFKSEKFRKAIAGCSIGANIQNLSQGKLSSYIAYVPPIEVQRKIADVLSAYDDLIENNRKQIKLLEEAAQRIYKAWFIDLRFPGHETTKIINGIPDGWERKKLIEIADIQYGYAFDGSLFNSAGKGTPIVRIRNIPTGTTEDYTTESADSQYLVKEGDILVGMDGEFHINTWCGESAYLVQRTCRIMPKDADMRGFLLLSIYDPIKFFEKTVVGATVAHLGKKHLDSIVLTIPTTKLYSQFQEFFFNRQNLMIQNRKLAEARDRLLPKLMNGELEVK